MDLRDIQNLIKFVAKSGASEVKLEMDDVKITIKTNPDETNREVYVQQLPVAQQLPQLSIQPQQALQTLPIVPTGNEAAPAKPAADSEDGPDKPLFVEVGSTVAKGSVICIIEAMKLFNEIESEVSGKIVKILVEDSTPVEFDQPLFLVDPS